MSSVVLGFVSMTIPMYLAETAPPSLRGTLTVVNNLFITGLIPVFASLIVFSGICFKKRLVTLGVLMKRFPHFIRRANDRWARGWGVQ